VERGDQWIVFYGDSEENHTNKIIIIKIKTK